MPVARALTIVVLALFAVFASPNAASASGAIVRSDLPLWSEEAKDVWPRFYMRNGQMGMESIFAVGDWRMRTAGCSQSDPSIACETWLRFSFLGPTDPGFIVTQAPTRPALAVAGVPSVIADLGAAPGAPTTRLYAIQIGFEGGSQYILVSAAQADVRQMAVLSVNCSTGRRQGVVPRRAKFYTAFATAYCAVGSSQALRALALDAFARPPVAALEWVGGPDR